MTGTAPAGLCALLSDCDGVIVDSEVIAEDVLVDVLAPVFPTIGVRDRTRAMIGMRVVDILQRLEAAAAVPLDDAAREALRLRVDSEVAERAGPIADVLEVYRALGLPIAVVSNSAFPRVHRSVERAGLLPLVGVHVYSAEDVGRPKPAPDGYLHAARVLGCRPADCVVVEDSPTGVRAAVAAGIRVLGFVGGSHATPPHAELLRANGAALVFDRMTELPATLAALTGRRF